MDGEYCTYPQCKCLVLTSTSVPIPICTRFLEDMPLRWESVDGQQPEQAQRSLTVPGMVLLVRRTLDKTKSHYMVLINGKPQGQAADMTEAKISAARHAAAALQQATKGKVT